MNTTTTALLVLVVLLIAIIATQRSTIRIQRDCMKAHGIGGSVPPYPFPKAPARYCTSDNIALDDDDEPALAAGIQAYTREVADRIGKPTAFDAKPRSNGASTALSQNSTNGKTRPQPWQGANRSEKL